MNIEILLSKAFQAGAHHEYFRQAAEPVMDYETWYNSDEIQELVKLFAIPDVSVTEGKLSPTDTAIQLLKHAKCRYCDGSGTVVSEVNPDGSIGGVEPCQWCYEKNELVGDN